MVGQTHFEDYKRQIRRMIANMSWQQVSAIGNELFVPIMQEHGQLPSQVDLRDSEIVKQAQSVLETMYTQAQRGDPVAARVFLQEASRVNSLREASNVIINIVPYDVADKLKVTLPDDAGVETTSDSDAEEVSLGDNR